MKKILSTILTLTMLSLPLAVQCSANGCYYDEKGNCIIEIPVSNENNDIAPKEEEKGFLLKVGSFCLKTLLFATVAVGATAALCKWSPNGEWAASVRDYLDDTIVPGAKNMTQSAKGYWDDTIVPGAKNMTESAYKSTKNWISNICLQPNVPCDPHYNISNCSNTNSSDPCNVTLGQWVSDSENWASEKWNKFINSCIIKGQDRKCQTNVKDVFKTVVRTIKLNLYGLFADNSVCPDYSDPYACCPDEKLACACLKANLDDDKFCWNLNTTSGIDSACNKYPSCCNGDICLKR